jgi:hypothetical protein
MRIFERWYFGLYRVMIPWRILVFFIRGFVEDCIFAWGNIWVSIILHFLPEDNFCCKHNRKLFPNCLPSIHPSIHPSFLSNVTAVYKCSFQICITILFYFFNSHFWLLKPFTITSIFHSFYNFLIFTFWRKKLSVKRRLQKIEWSPKRAIF